MHKIAILASGTGSNARQIIAYFQKKSIADVSLVITNRKEAGVIFHATEYGIPVKVFENNIWSNRPAEILDLLAQKKIDFLVLAGFLRLIPEILIDAYEERIINIHPALLPKYGGKGMYGMNVHRAILESKESETGITIHLVNKLYDKGEIIFQERVKVESADDADNLQKKVQVLEHAHFAPVIEKYLMSLDSNR